MYIYVLYDIFQTLITHQSVNNSNFTSVFFKQACHANPVADKKWARSSLYISRQTFPRHKLFGNFRIHLQTIIYHFEYTNDDNHLGFYY